MKKKVLLIVCISLIFVTAAVWFYMAVPEGGQRHDIFSGYDYKIMDGGVVVNDYNGQEEYVTIPKKIWGRPVVGIGYECFYKSEVKELSIPESVRKIYANAITYCADLEKITALGIEQLMSDAISYCDSLKEVDLGEEVVIVGDWALANNKSLKKVYLGETVEYIGIGAFGGDTKLVDLQVGRNVKEIGGGAFENCHMLKGVNFLSNVERIGSLAFAGTAVEAIPELKNLREIGGRVFAGTPWEEAQNTDFIIINNTLVSYLGDDETVRIPEGIEYIASVFYYSEDQAYPIQVKEVYIPDSVKRIGDFAFYAQKDITLYVPDSVEEIGENMVDEFSEENKYKIVTTSGSYAEQYAKEYGIDYEIVDNW